MEIKDLLEYPFLEHLIYGSSFYSHPISDLSHISWIGEWKWDENQETEDMIGGNSKILINLMNVDFQGPDLFFPASLLHLMEEFFCNKNVVRNMPAWNKSALGFWN